MLILQQINVRFVASHAPHALMVHLVQNAVSVIYFIIHSAYINVQLLILIKMVSVNNVQIIALAALIKIIAYNVLMGY